MISEGAQDLALKAGESQVEVALPSLPAGMNLAHCLLEHEKKVLDSAAIALSVTASATLSKIRLSKDAYTRGESVHADLSVTGEDVARYVLRVTLSDGFGRVISETATLVPPGRAVAVELPLADAISMRGVLDASLEFDKSIVDCQRATFIVTPPRVWDEFESILWAAGTFGGGHEHLFGPRIAEMRRMGMTAIVMNPYDYVPAYTDAVADHSMKIVTKGSGEETGRRGAKFGALLDMWADEQVVREDKTPAGLQAFRTWAQARYPSIEALNRVWETHYKAWDEVQPILVLEEAFQRNQATGTLNFSPWSEYRDYLDWKFAEQFRGYRQALERGDPEGRQGVSGTQIGSTLSGNDWWLLTRVFKALQNYGGGDQFRQHRSFSDMPLTPWAGYGAKGPRLRQAHWYHAFNGMNGVSYFAERTLLNPDYTWFEGASDTQRVLREIQTGPGKLLMHSRLIFDPIVFHYSQSSFHGAFALKQEALYHARSTFGFCA
jgi:hypothetical protein